MSYVPTSYMPPSYVQNDGDTLFWGSLLEPGPEFKPSAIFPRLTDALFFYLDEHAEPRRTGHIEPSKIVFWNKSYGPAATLDATETFNRIFFDLWKIPTRIVTARPSDPQAGKQIAVLDRYGFMMTILADVRGYPDETFKALSSAISLFGLIDPLTNQRFPMLPRSALPVVADPEALQLNAVIKQRFKIHSEQLLQSMVANMNWQRRAQIDTNNAIGPPYYEYRYSSI